MASEIPICQLERQGFTRGSCEVRRGKHLAPVCTVTLRSPTMREMLEAYKAYKSAGLEQIKLGNVGIFVRDEADQQLLERELGTEAL